MSWQIIKQPNGKCALWSSVVDNFIVLDCTPDDVVEEFVRDFRRTAEREVHRTIDALKRGEKPYFQFTLTWQEAVQRIRELHGADDEVFKVIAGLDPPG